MFHCWATQVNGEPQGTPSTGFLTILNSLGTVIPAFLASSSWNHNSCRNQHTPSFLVQSCTKLTGCCSAQGHRECVHSISPQTLAWTAMPLRFRQCIVSHGSECPPHQRPSWFSDRWRAWLSLFTVCSSLGLTVSSAAWPSALTWSICSVCFPVHCLRCSHCYFFKQHLTEEPWLVRDSLCSSGRP